MRGATAIPMVVLFVLLGMDIGCHGGNGNNFPPSPVAQFNISGSWNFTTFSARGNTVGTGTLVQSGSTFTGMLILVGGCASTSQISGRISGASFDATVSENSQAVNLTGTIASNGNSASGNFTSTAGGCTDGDAGTWVGTMTSPASGSFVGTLMPADRMPVGASLALSQDGTEVSGVASFTNSACLASVDLLGTVSGSAIDLKGSTQDSSVTLQGTLTADGKSLRIDSVILGLCEAESGSGSLSKIQ
jgi:hypothetical protein